MKILFFGSTQGTACSLHYFTALVRLGHEVIPFDPQYFDAKAPWERLWIRARKAPWPSRSAHVARTLVEICKQNDFDMVFVMAENFLTGAVLEEVRGSNPSPPVFVYHSHDNNFSPGILKPAGFFESLADYDFVFTTKSQNVARYREHGCREAHFMPSAYESTVHRPIDRAESRLASDFDVTFVGTFDKSRAPYFDAVGWHRLHVWGGLWERSESYAIHRDKITARPIYYYEFADVMSRSKCALGLLREEAGDLHTQRTFEIPACGALQIAPRNDEILSFFTEDKEIVCFSTLAELKDKTDFYVRNDRARAKVAAAGRERCLKDSHSYVERVGQMLERVTGKRRRRKAAGMK